MNFSPRNKLLAFGLAGVLAVGAAGAVFADSGSGSSTSTPAAATSTATPGAKVKHPVAAAATLKDVIKQSGLPASVFAQGFKDGKTVNQVLSDNGKDPAAIQAAVLADIQARLDKAVSNNKISQQPAADAYAKAQEALPKLMDSTPKPGALVRGAIRLGVRDLLGVAAKDLNMDVKDLAQELKGGQTIAQIAASKGVDVNTIITDMQNEANARLDQAKTKVDQKIADFVNNGHK